MIKVKEWLLRKQDAQFKVRLRSKKDNQIISVNRLKDDRYFDITTDYCDNTVQVDDKYCHIHIIIETFYEDLKMIRLSGRISNMEDLPIYMVKCSYINDLEKEIGSFFITLLEEYKLKLKKHVED